MHAVPDMLYHVTFLCDRGHRACSIRLGLSPRQRPIDVINILSKKLRPMFDRRDEELHIEHVTNVRDWDNELPNAVKLYGAYRRRKRDYDDNKVIPHSFTFVRRECSVNRCEQDL